MKLSDLQDRIKVERTANPDGSEINHKGKVFKPNIICVGGDTFFQIGSKKTNKVKSGGICHQELSLLDQAKKLLYK